MKNPGESWSQPKKEKAGIGESLKKIVNFKNAVIFSVTFILTSFALQKSGSQEKTNESANSLTGPDYKIEWFADKTGLNTAAIEEVIESQRGWLYDYTQSAKYSERLTKECMRTEFFLNSKANSAEDVKVEVESLLLNPNTSEASEKIKNKVSSIIDSRLLSIDKGLVKIVDTIPSSENSTTSGQYSVTKDGEILLRKDFYHFGTAVALHEFTHRQTESNNKMEAGTIFILRNRVKGNNEYLKDPTEIHARVNELRFLLQKEGIYNALESDFTKKDMQEAVKSSAVSHSDLLKELLEVLDEEDLILLMNNIAGTNMVTVDAATTA